jgi:hypothetical protein
MLLCAFVNDPVDEFVLVYDAHFCRRKDRNVLCVQKTIIYGQHGEKAAVFGRFSLVDSVICGPD